MTAQLSWTNSATLTVLQSNSHVVLRAEFSTTDGAFNLLQADRLDRLHLPPCACQISNQIYDLNWVPDSREIEWTLSDLPDSKPRFFRLLLEPVLSRGRVLVFPNGPIDWSQPLDWEHPTYVQPTEVWVDNLGSYDPEGNLTGSNEGTLTGFYVETGITTTPSAPPISRLVNHSNDFRLDYTGATGSRPPRDSLSAATEAHLYWAINDYRTRFLNDAFLDQLGLPPEIDTNLRSRQHRPGLRSDWPDHEYHRPLAGPSLWRRPPEESLAVFPFYNILNTAFRSPDFPESTDDIRLSAAFDPEAVVSSFAGLVAFWVLGSDQGFPPDDGWGGPGWEANVLPAINAGISAWAAYRYSGREEQMRYYYACLRRWAGRACVADPGPPGPDSHPMKVIPCSRGVKVRNVMMQDRSDSSSDSIFPFQRSPSWGSSYGDLAYALTGKDGPKGSDQAGLYFGAVFYDMANEAGLGIHKADLLFWKTLSVITDSERFSMEDFGAKAIEAATALWGNRYLCDVADVLRSRGVSLPPLPNGQDDQGNFRRNLPPAIGDSATLDIDDGIGFGSLHPEPHPDISSYGGSVRPATARMDNAYTPEASEGYVAYQFYKHSQYGPCDKLALTDGTFSIQADGSWTYRNDGTFYTEFKDRELGNTVLLAPARKIRWLRSLQRCPNEFDGFYPEDVKPFGFRVIKAVANGFSFTVGRLAESETSIAYRLSIVDPSLATLGPALYTWSVTDHLGATTTTSGEETAITATRDEPFTLTVTRTRGATVDAMSWRERGNDLDRNGGQAFVRNLAGL